MTETRTYQLISGSKPNCNGCVFLADCDGKPVCVYCIGKGHQERPCINGGHWIEIGVKA
jgi:hypothetical protein